MRPSRQRHRRQGATRGSTGNKGSEGPRNDHGMLHSGATLPNSNSTSGAGQSSQRRRGRRGGARVNKRGGSTRSSASEGRRSTKKRRHGSFTPQQARGTAAAAPPVTARVPMDRPHHPPPAPAVSRAPTLPKPKLGHASSPACRFFATPGGCRRGTRCHFAHHGGTAQGGAAHSGAGSGQRRVGMHGGAARGGGHANARGYRQARPGTAGLSTKAFTLQYHGRKLDVLYTAVAREAAAWIDVHVTPPCCVGMDVECRPTFRKGQVAKTALVQIAVHATAEGANDAVLLAHVLHMKRIPEAMQRMLAHGEVTKTGVGIAQDVKQLASDLGSLPSGCVDLSHVVVRSPRFGGSLSLGGMAEALLSAPKWKSKRLALTRWDKPLAPKAMRYAALDAWVSSALFLHLRWLVRKFHATGGIPSAGPTHHVQWAEAARISNAPPNRAEAEAAQALGLDFRTVPEGVSDCATCERSCRTFQAYIQHLQATMHERAVMVEEGDSYGSSA